MTTKDTIIQVLREEIKWCKDSKDKSDKSEDWKKGFISGLRHAIRLTQLMK